MKLTPEQKSKLAQAQKEFLLGRFHGMTTRAIVRHLANTGLDKQTLKAFVRWRREVGLREQQNCFWDAAQSYHLRRDYDIFIDHMQAWEGWSKGECEEFLKRFKNEINEALRHLGKLYATQEARLEEYKRKWGTATLRKAQRMPRSMIRRMKKTER